MISNHASLFYILKKRKEKKKKNTKKNKKNPYITYEVII